MDKRIACLFYYFLNDVFVNVNSFCPACPPVSNLPPPKGLLELSLQWGQEFFLFSIFLLNETLSNRLAQKCTDPPCPQLLLTIQNQQPFQQPPSFHSDSERIPFATGRWQQWKRFWTKSKMLHTLCVHAVLIFVRGAEQIFSCSVVILTWTAVITTKFAGFGVPSFNWRF